MEWFANAWNGGISQVIPKCLGGWTFVSSSPSYDGTAVIHVAGGGGDDDNDGGGGLKR
jgi:hypothetical protein